MVCFKGNRLKTQLIHWAYIHKSYYIKCMKTCVCMLSELIVFYVWMFWIYAHFFLHFNIFLLQWQFRTFKQDLVYSNERGQLTITGSLAKSWIVFHNYKTVGFVSIQVQAVDLPRGPPSDLSGFHLCERGLVRHLAVRPQRGQPHPGTPSQGDHPGGRQQRQW